MSDTKTKIVLDSNILIHFIKAERLSMLSQIYKGYKFVILSKVLDLEFKYPNSFRKIIERHVHLLHDIDIIDWQPSTEEEINDFAELREKHGPGECYCMVYCKSNNNIIASSDVKDISEYCSKNSITYLTTPDLLYHAVQLNLISTNECDQIILKINTNDSKLGIRSISEYKTREILI